jgi:ATP-dependent Clp protease adaptor protein ClpS
VQLRYPLGEERAVPETKSKTIEQESITGGRFAAIIYNNNDTAFDEVIEIIMLATSCGVEEARIETWEAHTFGQAAVHFASETECARVAATIASIGVATEVRPEWEN